MPLASEIARTWSATVVFEKLPETTATPSGNSMPLQSKFHIQSGMRSWCKRIMTFDPKDALGPASQLLMFLLLYTSHPYLNELANGVIQDARVVSCNHPR